MLLSLIRHSNTNTKAAFILSLKVLYIQPCVTWKESLKVRQITVSALARCLGTPCLVVYAGLGMMMYMITGVGQMV